MPPEEDASPSLILGALGWGIGWLTVKLALFIDWLQVGRL
jgi:hypothetical protein